MQDKICKITPPKQQLFEDLFKQLPNHKSKENLEITLPAVSLLAKMQQYFLKSK